LPPAGRRRRPPASGFASSSGATSCSTVRSTTHEAHPVPQIRMPLAL
jgi:hypothetical protein